MKKTVFRVYKTLQQKDLFYLYGVSLLVKFRARDSSLQLKEINLNENLR